MRPRRSVRVRRGGPGRIPPSPGSPSSRARPGVPSRPHPLTCPWAPCSSAPGLPLPPPLLLLLLLLSWPRLLRAGRPDTKVTALLGSSVELPCVSPEPTRLELDLLHVYWQIPEQPKDRSIASYLNGSGQRAEPRAQLVPTDMQRGDFTLHLANVTLADESPYRCLVFREMEKILERTVQLLVGANYSEPVVTRLEPEAGEDQVFTCTSSDGYPLPRVHWIEEDGSPLARGLQNTTVRNGTSGLYSVVSVLRLRQSQSTQVRCCVENQLLGQNHTSRQLGEAAEKYYQENGTTPSPRLPEETHTSTLVLLAMGMVMGVSLVVAMGWLCRNRWPYSATQTMVDQKPWPSTTKLEPGLMPPLGAA